MSSDIRSGIGLGLCMGIPIAIMIITLATLGHFGIIDLDSAPRPSCACVCEASQC